jgi:hypothetical protein
MDLDGAAAEPAASTLGEFGGLGDFGHSTEIDKKTTRRVFSACGHG